MRGPGKPAFFLPTLMIRGIAAFLAAAGTIGLAAASDDNWPQWRGPARDGRPAVKDIQRDWSKGLKKLWQVDDLCKGKNAECWSGLAIQDGRLVIPGREENRDTVRCLDALTGKELWNKYYDAPAPPSGVQYGNGARATPAIADARVFTFGCMGDLVCWDLQTGKIFWAKNMEQLGGRRPRWGYASSPFLYKDKVIVQGGEKVMVVAFNVHSGEVAWKLSGGGAGYAAPMLVEVAGKPQLIAFTGAGLVAVNPDDGTPLWTYPFETAFEMSCTTPVAIGERLLVSSSNYGDKGGTALLQLSPNGPKKLWANRVLGAAHNDPVVIDGLIYAFTGFSLNNRELQCMDLATGAKKWSTAEAGGPGNVVEVDGLLLCLGNAGKLVLAKPSAKSFEKITEFKAIDGAPAKGQPVWTAPILVGNRIYIRRVNQLICYAIK